MQLLITQTMGDFETFWKLGPWERLGRKAAERSFKASVKTEQDWADIQVAREAYVEHLRRNQWKKPQHGSTWFNNWRDWSAVVDIQTPIECECGQPLPDRSALLCDDCYRAAYIHAREEREARNG